MKKVLCVAMLLFVSIVNYSWAVQPDQPSVEPIIPDRPGQTNPPNVVPIGIVQLETGFVREVDRTGDIPTTNYRYNTSLVRIGLLENCEVRFLFEYAGRNIDSASHTSTLIGFNPISIGTKLAVCHEKGIVPQTSCSFSVTLPYLGKEEFRPTFLAPAFFLLMQSTLNDKLSLGYNMGLQWDGEQPNATAEYSVSISASISKGLSIFAECYGFSTEKSVSDYRMDFGGAYLISNDLQIDLSGGAGLNDIAPDWFVAFGLAWRWGK